MVGLLLRGSDGNESQFYKEEKQILEIALTCWVAYKCHYQAKAGKTQHTLHLSLMHFLLEYFLLINIRESLFIACHKPKPYTLIYSTDCTVDIN